MPRLTITDFNTARFFGYDGNMPGGYGKYMPIYPNPWAGEQLAQGIVLDPILRYHNYLSWNGTWSLDFTVPIFTWIHTIEDLGWVYR